MRTLKITLNSKEYEFTELELERLRRASDVTEIQNLMAKYIELMSKMEASKCFELFADQDDIWNEDKLRRAIDAMGENKSLFPLHDFSVQQNFGTTTLTDNTLYCYSPVCRRFGNSPERGTCRSPEIRREPRPLPKYFSALLDPTRMCLSGVA